MTDHPAVAQLTRMAQESAEAYLAGDLDTYARVLPHADDFTLMPPFGGPIRQGFVLDDETREATRSTFRGGRVKVEVDASYITDNLAVLAVVSGSAAWWAISPSRTGPSASPSPSDVTAHRAASARACGRTGPHSRLEHALATRARRSAGLSHWSQAIRAPAPSSSSYGTA